MIKRLLKTWWRSFGMPCDGSLVDIYDGHDLFVAECMVFHVGDGIYMVQMDKRWYRIFKDGSVSNKINQLYWVGHL